MCVISMVHEQYDPKFPYWDKDPFFVPIEPAPQQPVFTWPTPVTSLAEREELRKLIGEFREAVAAAKTVDRLTGQPDCLDPEKAKLEVRVAQLEKRLNELDASPLDRFRRRILGKLAAILAVCASCATRSDSTEAARRYMSELGIEGHVVCASIGCDSTNDCTLALPSGQLVPLTCDDDTCRVKQPQDGMQPIPVVVQ